MNRHPMRWDALVFAILFALVAGGWAVLDHDLVDLDVLAVAGPIALILAGLAGVALTLRRKS